jgi:hypothetical protein
MQPYYVHLLILVAPRREHQLVVWKHPPSCSKLTSSNVLVQHLLEDPPYPIAPRQTFSGAQHYYRLQIFLSVLGGYSDTRLGSISHYNQSGSSPGPLILEAFWQYKHCTDFPSSKKIIYGSHNNVCFRRAAAIFGGKKRFVVTKDNYGDHDYEFD